MAVASSKYLSVVSVCSIILRRFMTAVGLFPQTIEIDGDTTIHFWGPPNPTSKPKLVLIHGFGLPSIWQWWAQPFFFTRQFDLYMPDLIFFGNSFTKSTQRSEIFQATTIAKFLQSLGISRYSVAGTSYGGFVAYRMADMWPERVDKVVIASSALNMRRSDIDTLLKKANVATIDDALMPPTAKLLWTVAGFVLSRRPYLPDFVLNDFVNKLISKNRKEKMELLKELTIGRDEAVTISPLSQKVLIVWGENDNIFALEKAVELKKLLGEKAILQFIKKGSHVPQLENALQFNKIVKVFLCDF